ncbi:MAG: hypothetical protein ACPL6F_01090, partial [Anaerolineales bacterium]
ISKENDVMDPRLNAEAGDYDIKHNQDIEYNESEKNNKEIPLLSANWKEHEHDKQSPTCSPRDVFNRSQKKTENFCPQRK